MKVGGQSVGGKEGWTASRGEGEGTVRRGEGRGQLVEGRDWDSQ